MTRPLVIVAVFCALAQTGSPDLTGKWTFTMDPDFRGNRAVVDCTIKQRREAVTVKCGDGVEMKGEVNKLTVMFRTPPMTTDRLVATYEGKTNDSRTTLEGTWRLKGGALDEKGKFSAKKRP